MAGRKAFKIAIPTYSLPEELINAISHGTGALLSVAALILCVVKSAVKGDGWAIFSGAVYGGTLVVLYLMSTLYHSFKPNKAKRIFRVIDHCSIFLLIAGTYTPYTLVSLRDTVGWPLFFVAWGASIFGIVLNIIDLKKYAVLSLLSYIAIGGLILFAYKPLSQALSLQGISLMIAGGIVYILGAALYAAGKKVKYLHSVFHFFVIGGSALHFISIFFYVL